MPVTFRGALQPENPAAVEVAPDVLSQLDVTQKRPPVRVTINGVELRTTIAVYGGRSYIGLRREMREAMHVAPGQTFDVSLELDTDERSVELPDDLAAALAADPEAQQAFERLAFTNRKEYVEWVTGAKRDATRQARVAQAPTLLKSGRRTPLAS